MRPWVQYGRSIGASGDPYTLSCVLPSHSTRPDGRPSNAETNAWYSVHCFGRRRALAGRVLVAAVVPPRPVRDERLSVVDRDQRTDGEHDGQNDGHGEADDPGRGARRPLTGTATRGPGRAAHELGTADPHQQEDAEVPEREEAQVPHGRRLDVLPEAEREPGQRGDRDEHERGAPPPDDPADQRGADQRRGAPLPRPERLQTRRGSPGTGGRCTR